MALQAPWEDRDNDEDTDRRGGVQDFNGVSVVDRDKEGNVEETSSLVNYVENGSQPN
eukprot:CAMPEP_0184683232 /NCGR_PEP_ID=MMETSP0312-20130426/10418_1 /TAXON_ID=31354 /ORGANISM="Compsopogon coeruleus, Strain SAG 36.94" /LENGTH=56 /DNA_ID=CAMNT_0027135387 /DNA_START=238 /DNA_END=404 /DNA_ORIENTATION=+